jgi:hypothetical protein
MNELNLPDYEIEQYWNSYKKSIINFYNQNKQFVNCPIYDWCINLNNLQKQEKYIEIEYYIREYISIYAIDLIKICDLYHINILVTNIKRWNKITEKYKISISKSKYYNFVFLLIDIIYSFRNDIDNLSNIKKCFINVEDIINNNNYKVLVKLSIDINKPSIIDKLLKYDNSIYLIIEELYDLPHNSIKNFSSKKIFKILN